MRRLLDLLPQPSRWALCLALLGVVGASGCVQRRMTIRSNPPGAAVYIDDQQIGVTPVSTDFIYYGSRKISIMKQGYETLTVSQPVPPPWYQYPGLDFVSENVVPWEIRDERSVTYNLQPIQNVSAEELRERANVMRNNSKARAAALGVAQPAPPAMISGGFTAGEPVPGAFAPPETIVPGTVGAPLQVPQGGLPGGGYEPPGGFVQPQQGLQNLPGMQPQSYAPTGPTP